MRHFDISLLQVRHPALFKRSAAVAAIGLLVLIVLGLTVRNLGHRRDAGLSGLWGISGEIVAPEKHAAGDDAADSAKAAAASRSRWPKNSHYSFNLKDTQWAPSKDYVFHFQVEPTRTAKPAPTPKKERAETSLAFVPVKFIVVELMEAEEQAASEAGVADPTFGKNYQRIVADVKTHYHDGIRLKHDLSQEQFALVYRLALQGTAQPRVLTKKAA